MLPYQGFLSDFVFCSLPFKRIAIVSSRKPGYLLGILLLAALCTAPHLIVAFNLATEAALMRQLPFQFNLDWNRVVQKGSRMSHTPFARDRFYYISHRWNLQAIDPSTRNEASLNIDVRGGAFRILTFGSRLWLVGSTEAHELIDGTFQSSTMSIPNPWVADQQRFLLDGEPVLIAKSGLQFAISTFEAGAWVVTQDLLLPDSQREIVINDMPLNFQKATQAICINQGDRVHLFLEVDGWMLYREGLDLQAVTGTSARRVSLPEEPVSALNAANMEGGPAVWTLINKVSIADVGNNFTFRNRSSGNKFGLLLNGQPAALIVDGSDPATMVGHLFRFDGRQWTEFATQTFPFGTAAIRTVVSQDDQTSFIVATTSTGVVHAYEVDAAGVRPTPGNREVAIVSVELSHLLLNAAVVLLIVSILGGFLGVGTAFLMWFYTRPDYEFGMQRIRLARIFGRGAARLIDLALIGLSTAALAWWLTRHLDWLSLAEAVNLRLPHPAVQSATRTVWTLIVWLITCEALLVIGQARWGLTIGKWCCGIRTLQTSLRPCGFARSLVRELIFWVDVCGLLCWTPGVVSIALTDRRQRLSPIPWSWMCWERKR
ncbi:MAG: domain containing protein [Schlesneria sp.]|nr:domain containing protein [Schlesneria sp.]